ncbi:MAG: hypothetical protein AB8E15_01925 [Bdellovibrionales bacterium]
MKKQIVIAGCFCGILFCQHVFADLQENGQLILDKESQIQITEMRNLQLELTGDYWAPKSVQEMREYFYYHKDFEVKNVMIQYSMELGFNLPMELINIASRYHDMPKVLGFEELTKYGYKGWPVSIAFPFLSAIYGKSEIELRKELKGMIYTVDINSKRTEYLKIDLATRLYLSFGISRANYTRLFPKHLQEAIFAELKAIPEDINRTEKVIEKTEKVFAAFEHSKELILHKNVVEVLADFTVRTQNPLADYEYGKIFQKTSTLIKNYLTTKNQFVDALIEHMGIDFLEKFGHQRIYKAVLVVEKSYFDIVNGARTALNEKPRATTNTRGPRVDFMAMITKRMNPDTKDKKICNSLYN